MHPLTRRGFTLIELLIALIIMGVIGTILIRTMNNIQRVTGSQSARMESQESMRAAAYYLSSVLRELDANDGDLATAGASTIRYRAPRWIGISCSGVVTAGSNIRITVRRSDIY